MSRATTAAAAERLPLHHGGRVPRVGLGTWQLEGRECERAVERALGMGYRHVDTAEAYGNEEAIARALGRAGVDRDELFLTSKVWRDHLRGPDVRRACEASLRRLGTDRLDLYLVHWPDSDVPIEETVEAMERLREDGRVRAWGVSNFTVAHLTEVLGHATPSANQVELHPRLRQAELDRFCAEHGVRVIAYSPLAQGDAPREDALEEIGSRHGRSGAQVALRWSVQHGHVVIPRSSDEEHLAANLALFDFELAAEEMERIDALDRGERHVAPDFAEFDRA